MDGWCANNQHGHGHVSKMTVGLTVTVAGELRALPVGRGKIGRVKYLEVGRAVGRDNRPTAIPASVIKTGVKLPQLQSGSLLLQEEDKVWSDIYILYIINYIINMIYIVNYIIIIIMCIFSPHSSR